MKTYESKLSALPLAVASVIVILISAAIAADEPSPTPTPYPRKLGDIKLKTGETEPVVISDANLAEMADRGTVTICGSVRPRSRGGSPSATAHERPSIWPGWRTSSVPELTCGSARTTAVEVTTVL